VIINDRVGDFSATCLSFKYSSDAVLCDMNYRVGELSVLNIHVMLSCVIINVIINYQLGDFSVICLSFKYSCDAAFSVNE